MERQNNPFILFPDSLQNRTKLKAILMDFFPDEKVKANVILIAFDAGIATGIQNCRELDALLFSRYQRILMDDFGLVSEKAVWAIDYWFEYYGKQYLHKSITVSANESNRVINSPNIPIKKSFSPVKSVVSPDAVIVEKLKEHEKLPKSIIKLYPDEMKKFGYNSCTCVVRCDYIDDWNDTCSLKIMGNYDVVAKDTSIMMVMVFNNADEMIEMSSDFKVHDKDKEKSSFSINLCVPIWETISRIEMHFTKDPASIW